MKRIIAVSLALTIVFACASTSFASTAQNPAGNLGVALDYLSQHIADEGGSLDTKGVSIAANAAAALPEPATVEFYYNYTGAPATRPASFTKQADADGKLSSFPVEQTLPQVGSRADYGFVGWYRNAGGTGEKVTLETVFTEDTASTPSGSRYPRFIRSTKTIS